MSTGAHVVWGSLREGWRVLWRDVRGPWSWLDTLVALLSVWVGWLVFIGRWRGNVPFVRLDSDAAAIASFAAAKSDPGAFEGDLLLGNIANFDFYLTVQIPLVRLLTLFTDDFGFSFILPTVPLVAVHLFGFYVLGRVLFSDRFLGLLLSASTVPLFGIVGLGTYWGIKGFTTPRDWFAALIPWVLAAAFHYRRSPRAWFALFAAMGLMMYVHPVSTPGWAWALWMALWTVHPKAWSFKRRFAWMFACGLTFLATAAPFVINYLIRHESGPSGDYEKVLAAINYRYISGYSDIAGSVDAIWTSFQAVGLVSLAALGAGIWWRFGDARQRDFLAMLLVMLVGLVLIADVVPIWEHAWALENKRIPFEYDLVRGTRYAVPVLTMLALAPLSLLLTTSARPGVGLGLVPRGPGRISRRGVTLVVGLLLAVSYGESTQICKPLRKGWAYFKDGKVRPHPSDKGPRYEALLAAKNKTKRGTKFLAYSHKDAVTLKYFALRPVVHNWKDGGNLSYSNHATFLQWFEDDQRFRRARKAKGDDRLRQMVAFARYKGADAVMMNFGVGKKLARELGLKMIYNHRTYSVASLQPAPKPTTPGPRTQGSDAPIKGDPGLKGDRKTPPAAPPSPGKLQNDSAASFGDPGAVRLRVVPPPKGKPRVRTEGQPSPTSSTR